MAADDNIYLHSFISLQPVNCLRSWKIAVCLKRPFNIA